MLALSLAACGGSSGGDAQPSGSQQSGQTEKNKESEQAEESNSGKVLVDESGKDLTFRCRNASVNGYMVGTTMSADVELSFHIYDMNSWDAIEDTDIITLSF